MGINIQDFEVFKYGENRYTQYENNGKQYWLNKHPYLDVVLTDRCNQNCSFCIADLIHDKLDADLEIMKAKIRYAVQYLNVREVLVLGGEPTVSLNLIPMLEFLSTLNLDKVVMTTNGLKLAKEKDFRMAVFGAGLTNLNISFMNIVPLLQKQVCKAKNPLSIEGIEKIYKDAKRFGIKVRINNNIFKDNNDSVGTMEYFYEQVRPFCDSVKFSPLFSVDSFSVIDVKTEWVRENRLDDTYVEELFTAFEEHMSNKYDVAVIENDLQFGFVKNTMIPLRIPILMNWNFGDYTGMMKRVKEQHQINNLKLLPNNELSLSWNRELTEYFIKT
ncbi:MAG TPA: radical SAM protein [Lentimicrobium sp.]|nr:radical SAM protein [Lentimicrobium sp.]